MAKMGFFGWLLYVLSSISALNWGIYGASRLSFINKPFDLVTWAFSWMPSLGNVVFIIIGIAGLMALGWIPVIVLSKR